VGAGGSSGGSAVNVAKGYTTFSIGGDTGGSIRQPAGYNKVYGLKPTYGRISRYGLMAYASSTDCVGPFAKELEDILILLNLMSGRDYHDQTTFKANAVEPGVLEEKPEASKFTVGYYKSFIENPALDADMKADFMASLEKLKEAGVEVRELDFYDVDTLVATYYILAMAETASNLSRLDGTNYGGREDEKSLKDGYMLSRSKNFTEETKRRIVGGNQVLSAGHSEEIYMKAQSLRSQIVQSFEQEFKDVNVILSPVAPSLPPKIGENLKEPLAMYLSDAYTVGFSLGGLPTMTAPKGTEIGMQITSAKGQEQTIIEFAHLLNEVL
jgi:aspartyl-tRNA(Asn)/glutamyl-tRNA(Gln) amidotransferase subunit A